MSTKNTYGWFVVGTTLANQSIAMGVLLSGYALFVLPWAEEFQVPQSQVLLGSTIVLVVNSLASPFAGKLMDKLSLRTLILIGVACLAAGLLLISFASAFWMILAAYATLLPAAIIFCGSLSSQTLVSKWFTEGRGVALGVSSLGSSVGGFVLPLVISALIAAFDWRMTMIILAVGAVAVLFPLNGLVLRKDPPKPADPSETDTQAGAQVEPDWIASQLVRMPTFWIPVLGIVPLMAAYTGVQFNLGALVNSLSFGEGAEGVKNGLAAKLISTIAVGQVIGKLAASSASERIDHRVVYWIMAVLMAAALFLLSGEPSVTVLYIACLLLGSAVGATLPMLPIFYTSRLGAKSIGVILGIATLVLILGSFGSYVTGLIYEATQSYDTAFLAMGALLIPVSIAMFFLPSPEKARKSWPQATLQSAATEGA
ncbi:MFS transporter [Ruegeria sp. HKCCE3926]|uniref:MFS transporter n=1 Tax=Ruegeria sp. HKCCE3926 TaxID=2794831 RepID=UPI001AE4C497|nr:MFS transporter [Ruegeria sp. HKCCE3926]